MPECNICQCDFIGRPDAKTCSSRCRQALYRLKRTPIETNIILDLTDAVGMAKLRKVLDVITKEANENPDSPVNTVRGDKVPPEFWERLIPGYTGNDPIFDTMTDIAMNNPKNWQPAKYQHKAKPLKNSDPIPPEADPDDIPF